MVVALATSTHLSWPGPLESRPTLTSSLSHRQRFSSIDDRHDAVPSRSLRLIHGAIRTIDERVDRVIRLELGYTK